MLPYLFSIIETYKLYCDTFILAKHYRVTYLLSMNKHDISFALIHSDVWGSSLVLISSGVCWFMTFTYDCIRMTWLYLLKYKDEEFKVF